MLLSQLPSIYCWIFKILIASAYVITVFGPSDHRMSYKVTERFQENYVVGLTLEVRPREKWFNFLTDADLCLDHFFHFSVGVWRCALWMLPSVMSPADPRGKSWIRRCVVWYNTFLPTQHFTNLTTDKIKKTYVEVEIRHCWMILMMQ